MSGQLKIDVVTDMSPEDIISIEKGENELPDKVFIAYKDRLMSQSPNIQIGQETYGAYIYNSEDDYKKKSAESRPVDMVSTLRQNGISNKEPSMLIMFNLKSPPG